MTVSHIHASTAKRAHDELIVALGTENNPGQWMVFMHAVKRYLPFLFEAGRPTKEQIQSSVIGQLGFASWAEMVEAGQEDGGLSWSVNSWKLWSKAFKVVSEFEYLTEMEITASAVMKLKSTFKEVAFPASAEELEQAKVELVEQKKAEEAERVSSLKVKVSELEQQLLVANTKLDVLGAQNVNGEELRTRIAQLDKEVFTLKSQVENYEDRDKKSTTKLGALQEENEQLAKKVLELESMGRWAHLGKFFKG